MIEAVHTIEMIVSHHEAGHAVAAWLVGAPVASIHIEHDCFGKVTGSMNHGRDPMISPKDEGWVRLSGIVAAAGPISERIFQRAVESDFVFAMAWDPQWYMSWLAIGGPFKVDAQRVARYARARTVREVRRRFQTVAHGVWATLVHHAVWPIITSLAEAVERYALLAGADLVSFRLEAEHVASRYELPIQELLR